jgi:hypothetical protein
MEPISVRFGKWRLKGRTDHLRKQNPPAKRMITTALDLMMPVHMVASSIKAAGKPFEWLAHEAKNGLLDLKAQFDPPEDWSARQILYQWR